MNPFHNLFFIAAVLLPPLQGCCLVRLLLPTMTLRLRDGTLLLVVSAGAGAGAAGVSTSRTATISAPGKRSSTARTIGACITLSIRAALACFF